MENYEKTDARKIGIKGQINLRKVIVKNSKRGEAHDNINIQVGASRSHVYQPLKDYKEKGDEAFKQKQRGRKEGEKRRLSAGQEREIKRLITDKTPEQLKFKECLWTRKGIRQLIKRKYGIEIADSTLGDYMKRWGFTVQRPVQRAYKQDGEKIDKWLNTEYPGITDKAKAESAEIYFGDETSIQNTANYMRGYAPKGKTPVVRKEAKKLKINMISAVNKRGKMSFMLCRDNIDSGKIIDFMERLTKGQSRKIFLIVDNMKAHHSKKVSDWVSKNKEKIELFFLPPYAPEYNPDELLNSDIKRNAGAKQSPRTQEEMESNVSSRLDYLSCSPEIVSSFFQAPYTKYAC